VRATTVLTRLLAPRIARRGHGKTTLNDPTCLTPPPLLSCFDIARTPVSTFLSPLTPRPRGNMEPGGRVVFVSSLAALGPAPSVAAYAAAKAFTASFAASLRRYGTLPLSLPSLSLPYPP